MNPIRKEHVKPVSRSRSTKCEDIRTSYSDKGGLATPWKLPTGTIVETLNIQSHNTELKEPCPELDPQEN